MRDKEAEPDSIGEEEEQQHKNGGEDDPFNTRGKPMKLMELQPGTNQDLAFGTNSSTLDRIAKLGSDRLNLVTVFGETRTGKSFLLNQLVGVPHFFRVSRGNEPCTAGADISNMCTLRQFAKGLSGTVDEEAPHIAFIDAEGYGGNGDDEHHQKLISPLLIVSKVVVFNSQSPS